MFINGLLPSSPFHNTHFLSSIHSRPHLTPSTCKIEATTAQIFSLKDSPHPNRRYPEKQSFSRLQNTDGCANSSVQVTEDEIGECLSLLNQINMNGSICREVHGRLLKMGALKASAFIGNKLVVAYSRNTELLNDAQKLFDEMPKREVFAYAAFIGSFCRLERWIDVLSVLRMMVNDGMLPDKYLIPTILKACSVMQLGKLGKIVYGYVIRRGIEEDVFIGNALIDMYANCGDLRCSKSVFDTMSSRDVVSWTALLVAYMFNGFLDEAMDTFRGIELDGLKPDLISWNALISGFAQNGEIESALLSLEEMEGKGLRPKVNTWNGIISGCVQNEYYKDALDAFIKMFSTSLAPNAVTIASILPACAGINDLNLGKAIHGHAIKLGLCGNIHVEGSLIDMYWKCGKIDYAENVFVRMKHKSTTVCNEMISAYVNVGKLEQALTFFTSMKHSGPKPDVITFNTMLGDYIKNGKKNEVHELLYEMSEMGLQPNVITFNILLSGNQQSGLSHEALKFFQAMQLPYIDSFPSRLTEKSIRPNHVTITSALAACADLSLTHHGKELHGYVVRNSLESNIFVSCSLVDMYAKCYDMNSALEVFFRTTNRNTVMWNTLMAGYINQRQPHEVFGLFNGMLKEELKPSPITFMILLPACGEIGAIRLGRELHGFLIKFNFEESNNYLISALIDMYAKCGSLSEAERVFNTATFKDVAIWNAMISSFSSHGMTEKAIALFEQMETSGGDPDGRTFVALHSACARRGLVEEGWKYFNLMEHNYGIIPSLEHYTCMVGIMGTSGLLNEALEFIKKMPFTPDACIWATLLQACRTHSNPEIGERAAKALFELEPENASNYIILSNIYASAGLWDSSKGLRNYLKEFHSMNLKECSCVLIGSKLHAFEGGRKSSPMMESIMGIWYKLADKMRHEGNFAENPVFGDVKEINPFSCLHTEKLAICLGIISSSAYQPIRVSKNLRMCIDCHTSAKLISKIIGREIFVKDGAFYHHMKDGICSCQDRW